MSGMLKGNGVGEEDEAQRRKSSVLLLSQRVIRRSDLLEIERIVQVLSGIRRVVRVSLFTHKLVPPSTADDHVYAYKATRHFEEGVTRRIGGSKASKPFQLATRIAPSLELKSFQNHQQRK